MQNWRETILSQYGASPIILSLIGSFDSAVDPSGDIDRFYSYVWNIATAVGYGLDVWGRIVGVSRVLQLPAGQYLGFQEAHDTVSEDTFGFGVFWFGVPASGSYSLSDAAYRTLILAKALSNISNSSIHAYNTILMELFPGRGNAYVSDTGNMTEQLTFEFALAPFEVAIIKQSGAIAAPTGVGFNIMVIPVPTTFGFAEAGYSAQSFNNGTFFAGFL